VATRGRVGWGRRFGSNLNLLFIFNFYLCSPNLIIRFSTNMNLKHVKKLIQIFAYLLLLLLLLR
jgi:hypothetical protein